MKLYKLVFLLPLAFSQACFASQDFINQLRRMVETNQPSITVGKTKLHAVQSLKKFYVNRGFSTVWWDQNKLKPAAKDLLNEISNSQSHGLVPEDYHFSSINNALKHYGGTADVTTQVQIEATLSDAWFQLASHYLAGKVNPESIDAQWTPSRRNLNLVDRFTQAVDEGKAVESIRQLLPAQPGYQRLKQLLSDLQKQSAQRQQTIIVPPGEKLRRNDDGERVQALRARLRQEDSTVLVTGPFDAELEEAVRRYQANNGLATDGIVGPSTLHMLNLSIDEKIAKVIVNIERWRWMPESLGGRHIRVNIADFNLEIWENQQMLDAMKVIVGRSYRRTPLFSDRIRYLVFNPAWEIPLSIAAIDKLPQLQKDPAKLAETGYVVVNGNKEQDVRDIDWSKLTRSKFPYQLRQRPGPQNALGTVKIMFPNQYNVYLHDTSNPELFEKGQRTFSSGCIRVQEPEKLSIWLLQETPGWNQDNIKSVISSKKTQTVNLAQPVPVHIQYMTAWVREDGSAHFRDDIYQRDNAVLKALTASPE